MSDIWDAVQRIAKYVVPKPKEEQAASDTFEREYHHANGLGYYTLKELVQRAAVAVAEQEVGDA